MTALVASSVSACVAGNSRTANSQSSSVFRSIRRANPTLSGAGSRRSCAEGMGRIVSPQGAPGLPWFPAACPRRSVPRSECREDPLPDLLGGVPAVGVGLEEQGVAAVAADEGVVEGVQVGPAVDVGELPVGGVAEARDRDRRQPDALIAR